MRQLLLIHGGMTFPNQEEYLNHLQHAPLHDSSVFLPGTNTSQQQASRKKQLIEKFSDSLHIITPSMPNKHNAHREERKIRFERYIEYLDDGCILLGVSLGGIFLAHYLSRFTFPKNIFHTILVAPPFDSEGSQEFLTNGFELPDDLSMFAINSPTTDIFFSADDTIVPPLQAKKYASALPQATIHLLDNKNGHFIVDEIPELESLLTTIIT